MPRGKGVNMTEFRKLIENSIKEAFWNSFQKASKGKGARASNEIYREMVGKRTSAFYRLNNVVIRNIPDNDADAAASARKLADFLFKEGKANFQKIDVLCEVCTSKEKYNDLAILGKEGIIGKYNLSYDELLLYKKFLYSPARKIEAGLAPGIGLSLGTLYPGRKTRENGMGMIGGVKL